jgi:hypothetical protein
LNLFRTDIEKATAMASERDMKPPIAGGGMTMMTTTDIDRLASRKEKVCRSLIAGVVTTPVYNRALKHAYFEALDANLRVVQTQDESGRTKITDAVYQWFAKLQLSQGKDQQVKSEKRLRAYNYRLGFFLDFAAQQKLHYLDQIDRKQLLRYVKFLRDHKSDLDDRTVHNIFET